MNKIAGDMPAGLGGKSRGSVYFSWPFLGEHTLGYALAPATVAIAFAARILLTPVLNDGSRYLFFVPAVLIAAAVGGLGPGLLATGLSALLGFATVVGFSQVSAPEIANALTFVVIGAGIAW